MSIELKTKSSNNPNVHLDYIINLVEIKPWPPCTSLKALRSVYIKWKSGEISNYTKKVVPLKGSGLGVDDGELKFNESFKLPVTLSRDKSVKNCIEFNLWDDAKNESLATAHMEFALDGIVQESLMTSVTMEFEKKLGNTAETFLYVKMHPKSLFQYLEKYKKSIEDPAGFWSDIASEFCWEWKRGKQVYSENLDVTKGKINIEWFKGGATNICYNCLDKNIDSGNGDKIALLWEGNELHVDGTLTYSRLRERVCQLANFLKRKGVKKGNTVIIYLPMIMELPITMLACARIGAVHSVVFAEYSAESLFQIIMDCKPKIVVTCNAVMRGKKMVNLKEIVDDALSKSSQNGISVVSCLTYENESAMKKEATKWQKGRDIWWKDAVPKCSTTCDVEWVDAENPLFLLYTSGSTGKPKGVLHTTGGYMIYTATTFKYAFDYKESDVYWCTADCGWITGHSYVTYGPLLNGATVVLYEGPVIVDEEGVEIDGECSGYLCSKSSWPGAFRTLHVDHERYEATYFKPFSGYYFSGDGCIRDNDGYHWLTGRVDDVINVRGHRIGTAEVESALVSHHQCAEAAVVGVEHEVKGQGIYAFVTLVEGVPYTEDLRKSLVLVVENQIGAYAVPDRIHWAPSLPKTRSGQIMRRILRIIASGQLGELGDTSTLADPSVVDQLIPKS